MLPTTPGASSLVLPAPLSEKPSGLVPSALFIMQEQFDEKSATPGPNCSTAPMARDKRPGSAHTAKAPVFRCKYPQHLVNVVPARRLRVWNRTSVSW